MKKKESIDKNKIGRMGEYLVAYELEKNGFSTTLTIKNTREIDVFAFDEKKKKSISIQVKTHKKGDAKTEWAVNASNLNQMSGDLFFVFVELNEASADYYVHTSKEVVNRINADHKKWEKKPGKNGQKHKDNTIRKWTEKNDKHLNNWNILRE